MSLSVLFRWPYVFLRFFNIFFLLIKKKIGESEVRQVQDWETELVENLFDLLYYNFPSTQGENRLPSTLKKNGKYDVKSYDELRSSWNIPFFGKAFEVLECLVRSLFSLGHQPCARF